MSENAKVVGDLEIVTVVGNLTSSNPADPEYLELTWTNPAEEQSGSYICEVNGLDPQGHSVMLQKSIAVNSADPEVRDLVKELNSLKVTFTLQYQDLAKENNDLKATVDFLTSEIQDLDKGNNDLKATVDGLTSEIQDLVMESNELKAIVATHKAPHTEAGIVHCGNSDYWPLLPGTTTATKERVMTVTFKRPYLSLPVISIAHVAGGFYVDSTNNIGRQWFVRNVTTTGFNMHCRTWSGTHYGSMDTSWTSIVA